MSRSSKKRQDILKAAIYEFKNNGFDSTSMDQIALTAEVSKRTVYNHFASKELLFDGILEQMMSLLKTSVVVQYQADVPLEEQLKDFCRQEIALLNSQEFTDLAKVCLSQAIHNPERINEALVKVESRDGDLTSWIKAAQNDNKLKPVDSEFATNQFFALIKAFCFWPQLIQDQPFPDEAAQETIINSAVEMFLGYYRV